jgi:N-acetylmuramoyl-L-alanine amidase
LVLSIHHDSAKPAFLEQEKLDDRIRYTTDRFSGYSLFVSNRNPRTKESVRFAKLIGEELLAREHHFTMHHSNNIAGQNLPVVDDKVGVFRYDGLTVLRLTAAPAVLFEAAVIVNPKDEARARDEAFKVSVAESIAAAVTRYCSSPTASSRPPASR